MNVFVTYLGVSRW